MSSIDTLIDDDVIVPDENVYGEGYPAVLTDFAAQWERLQYVDACRRAQEQESFKRNPYLHNGIDGHLLPEDMSTAEVEAWWRKFQNDIARLLLTPDQPQP